MKTVLNAILVAALASGASIVVPTLLSAQSGGVPAYGTWSTQGQGGWGSRYAPEVRLWLENEREIFQHGERMQLRFRTSDDAYVAVLHIDTDGEVELVYPDGGWQDSFVRGGLSYALPRGRGDGYWTVRSGSGIGYFYIIASAEPLNLRDFGRFPGGAWDGPFNGRAVRGDPFYALETLTRLLVGSPNIPYSVDTYSYSVGGRYRYPGYACSDAYASSAWDWNSYYGSCDRVIGLLRTEPFYYDTRRHRRDRDHFFREWPDRPRHGYKESATEPRGRGEPTRSVAPSSYAAPNPTPRESEAQPPRVTRPQPQQQPAMRPESQRPESRRPEPQRPESQRPESQRPRLERRPTTPEPRAAPPPAPQPAPKAQPAPERPRAEPKKDPPSPPSESKPPHVRRPDPEG